MVQHKPDLFNFHVLNILCISYYILAPYCYARAFENVAWVSIAFAFKEICFRIDVYFFLNKVPTMVQ